MFVGTAPVGQGLGMGLGSDLVPWPYSVLLSVCPIATVGWLQCRAQRLNALDVWV